MYPVHRQRLPAAARRGSVPDISAQVRATTNPGVQKPHCTAAGLDQRAMDGPSSSPARPSAVITWQPATIATVVRQLLCSS